MQYSVRPLQGVVAVVDDSGVRCRTVPAFGIPNAVWESRNAPRGALVRQVQSVFIMIWLYFDQIRAGEQLVLMRGSSEPFSVCNVIQPCSHYDCCPVTEGMMPDI